ncbi:hypothetical protein H0I26_17585 [Olleya sp. HaHaR_3_96]|nr:hypothetical protein H0I26_17585 [Olleya sp. HaHaR_3_96]
MYNTEQNSVKRIAEELDSGFDCYYNSKSDDIIAIPSVSLFSNEEDLKEAFQTQLETIEKHHTDFIKFEVLQSFQSFKIMEQFVQLITDQLLKAELEQILTNKKPFQNFKYKIDHSEFRQDWFDFKRNALEKIVVNQLNNPL